VREIDPGAQYADMYTNDFTAEQNQQFTQQFGEITQAMADRMANGAATTDEDVQALIARHYEFVSRFWKPNREAYISLAMSYILPSPYRDSYESVSAGLGKFHYDAIVEWATKNLD
jgi:predicted lipid-binding transport protein (Tim44 family)